jgi:hypothetical protein
MHVRSVFNFMTGQSELKLRIVFADKGTGRLQIAAMFTVVKNASFTAVAEEASRDTGLLEILERQRIAVASGIPPPTMAMAGSIPRSASPICIEPPLP